MQHTEERRTVRNVITFFIASSMHPISQTTLKGYSSERQKPEAGRNHASIVAKL